MKNISSIWKSLAAAKEITAADVFIYNILKAMTAKTPDKRAAALNLMQRAFTPVTKPIKLKSGRRPYDVLSKMLGSIQLKETELESLKNTPTRVLSCIKTKEEVSLYNDLKEYTTRELDRRSEDLYTFVFIRQDLSKEQQVVQSAHATLVLGSKLQGYDHTKLNFVVCGAKDLSELNQVKEHINGNGMETVEFTEPDLNNEVTALASFPMSVSKKRCMRRYKILTY